jgi:cleavage and polyadenylation specificity factor subunit 2
VAAVANYAFDVKVTPEMESLLKWQKVIGEFSVAHVVGKLELPQRGRIAKNSGQEFDSVPVANSQGEKPNEAVDLVPEVAEGVTIDDGGDAAQENEILLCPLNTAEELAAAPRSNPLLVGDVRLAELKRKLISLGHRAEFRAEGLLVCDDKVAVRKIAEGRIVIEGSVDSEFYETKDVVRSLLAVV